MLNKVGVSAAEEKLTAEADRRLGKPQASHQPLTYIRSILYQYEVLRICTSIKYFAPVVVRNRATQLAGT